MNYGYLRVAAVAPSVNVADCKYNCDQIIEWIDRLDSDNVKVAVFPELSVTAYTCGDLFHSATLLDAAVAGIERIASHTDVLDMLVVVGAPLRYNGMLYNCAVAIYGGEVVAVIPKTYVPNYNEFNEKRWWNSSDTIIEKNAEIVVSSVVDTFGVAPFGVDQLVEIAGVKIGFEIGEDLWSPIPPSSRAALAGADVIVNLSAANDLIGKYPYLLDLIKQQSARCIAGYVYASAGYGESTTDLVFEGKAVIAENGAIIDKNERWGADDAMAIADIDIEAIRRDRMHIGTFADCVYREKVAPYRCEKTSLVYTSDEDMGLDKFEPMRDINPRPFVHDCESATDTHCEEIVNIQVAGLARRMEVTRSRNLVVGISGGLDSTLALLVAVKTFDRLGLDRMGIHGVTMPGFGTTGRTYNNALTLMRTLGITMREISIVPAVSQHFKDINHDPAVHDVTYENAQARERTQILMDIANQVGGMVLGTGDLSELALGWATYNGDHMSMYGVNAGVPKTLVGCLVKWFALRATEQAERDALLDVVDTPISPELIPADEKGNIRQKTEDLVGPYELHDFVLFYVLRYGFTPRRIFLMARKAFAGTYDDDTIRHWMRTFYRRFFTQQFKRSCLPDGPKVGSVGLSPRGDWHMPSDAAAALWLSECDAL